MNAAVNYRIGRICLHIAAMMVDREFDPAEYDTVAKATQVGEIALQRRLYKSPAHSVFTIRALVGLEGITRGLGVKANYHRIFAACLRDIPG